jgi:hypothetical protein
VKFHTCDNFCAVWAAGARNELGLPPAPELVKWEWVVEAI